MNIAIINQWYPPYSGGGIAKYNCYIANAYRKLGHNVFVISSLTKDSKEYDDDEGISVYRIKQMNIPSSFKKTPFLGSFLRFIRDLRYSFVVRNKLIEIDKKFKIDIAEYAEVNAEGFVHSIFGPKRIPFVVRCHTPYNLLKKYYKKEERSFHSPFIYWMESRFIRKAPLVTTPSKDLAEVIIKTMKIKQEKVMVSFNVIDAKKFYPKVSSQADTIKLLFVGRIERGKGVLVLLEALKEIINLYGKRIKCVFVGQERQPIAHLFSQKDVAQNIEYKGKVTDDELSLLYEESDIFINPSLIYESFSYTCLEAMTHGVPAVASKIGGIPEVVEDGVSGFLFQPGNIKELVNKLKTLIDHPAKRIEMGEQARARVEKYFDSMSVAKDVLEKYKNIHEGK